MKNNKKKIIIFSVIAVAILAIVIGVVIAVQSGKNGDVAQTGKGQEIIASGENETEAGVKEEAKLTEESGAGSAADPAPKPSEETTVAPLPAPSEEPAADPAPKPSEKPAADPTPKPSEKPAADPTPKPSEEPAADPTPAPSKKPSETTAPTTAPSSEPAATVTPGAVVTSGRNNDVAPKQRVYDYADVLTDAEEKQLEAQIAVWEESAKCDLVLVTINQEVGASDKQWEDAMMKLADDFYDEKAFGYNAPHGDGALLLDNWYHVGEHDSQAGSWLSTSGRMIEEISESEFYAVWAEFDKYLEESAYKAYFKALEKVVECGTDSNITPEF